jgi:transposase InsO family protein
MIIKELEGIYSLEKMASYLKVSRQSYWRWKNRLSIKRRISDEKLKAKILRIFEDSRRVYGYRRIAKALRREKIQAGEKRVSRLMSELFLVAKARKKFKITTDSQHKKAVADDLVKRNFTASAPNAKCVSDITYVRTKRGWLYLCIILDLFSKKIVGWAISRRLKADLVVKAIKMASHKRGSLKRCIFHSDRGSQYCSREVRKLLKKLGMRQSMGKTGDCYDNSAAESFFHTLKIEGLFNRTFETRIEATLCIFEYIEVFYNRKRRLCRILSVKLVF